MMCNHRIVAEITRNWPGKDHEPGPCDLVSAKFEMVIEHNRQRGYTLESWQLSSVVWADGQGGHHLIETIVAVFIGLYPSRAASSQAAPAAPPPPQSPPPPNTGPAAKRWSDRV